MSTSMRLQPKTALHVELDDRQQRAASGALIAWRENLLRVSSAVAKIFARLVVLVVSPTALMRRVVLDAQLAGETQ